MTMPMAEPTSIIALDCPNASICLPLLERVA